MNRYPGHDACTAGCSVRYPSHVQGFGWTSEVEDNEVSGTTGQSRRLEARIRLTGPRF